MLSNSMRKKYAESSKTFLDCFYYLKPCSREVLDIMKNSYCNEDDPIVREFVRNFVKLYNVLINNQELVNAYNINEKLHFYRYQKVAEAYTKIIVPFKSYLDHGFFNTFSGRACTYRSIAKLLEDCDIDFDRTFSDMFCDYYDSLTVDEAKNFGVNPNIYLSLEDEIKEYFQAKYKKSNSRKFIKFYEDKKYEYTINGYDIDYIDFYKEYESMILGNIGELLYFEEIKNKPCAIFSARDIGTTVGCDMTYYDDRNNIERLVEVKTTAKYSYDGETDEFYIGRTELPILEQSVESPNFHYEIKRVFITFGKNNIESYKITTLIPRDKQTLIDEDGNIYRLTKTSDKNYFTCQSLKRKNKLVRD